MENGKFFTDVPQKASIIVMSEQLRDIWKHSGKIILKQILLPWNKTFNGYEFKFFQVSYTKIVLSEKN